MINIRIFFIFIIPIVVAHLQMPDVVDGQNALIAERNQSVNGGESFHLNDSFPRSRRIAHDQFVHLRNLGVKADVLKQHRVATYRSGEFNESYINTNLDKIIGCQCLGYGQHLPVSGPDKEVYSAHFQAADLNDRIEYDVVSF